jgi:hypothetical protein
MMRAAASAEVGVERVLRPFAAILRIPNRGTLQLKYQQSAAKSSHSFPAPRSRHTFQVGVM